MAPSFELPMAQPPLPGRERADARRNRERILCAAAALIARDGIDCVSMDDVAVAAGVGKGTLYRRFGDRSSLLRALIEEPERALQEELIRGLPPRGPGAPPAERLHAFGDAYLSFIDGHALFLRAGEQLIGGKRYTHPVYAFYRTHVGMLLRQVLPAAAPVDYLVDAILGPMGAEPFIYQRDLKGMTLPEIRAGWHTLVDAILA